MSKIKKEHYEHISDAMERFKRMIAPHRSAIIAEGKAQDIEKRLRWDLLRAAVPNNWICDNIYPYANDTHLDTALRRIVAKLESEPLAPHDFIKGICTVR